MRTLALALAALSFLAEPSFSGPAASASKAQRKKAETFHRRGVAALERSEPAQAVSQFYKAIAADLDFKEAYFDRARAYELQGEVKFAQEDYRSACRLGLKKACARLARAAPAKPDFGACLKRLSSCVREGKTYEACVLASMSCPDACVKRYQKMVDEGSSEAGAYREVFVPGSSCSL